MAHAFFLGIDVDGSASAPTLALIEKERDAADEAARYRLDRIRHHADALSPDALADHVQGVVAEPPYTGRTSIVVNRTPGYGQSLVEALRERGLDPVAVTLTPGHGATAGERDEVGVQLGAVDAVRALVGLYRDDRFRIEEHGTEAASRLARETQRAFEIIDAAEGEPVADEASGTVAEAFRPVDPHLASAALAVWVGTERSFDPSQHLKEDPQVNRSGTP